MPNTSVFISLMFPALYRRVCKNSKKNFCKKEFECTKCKATSKFFFSTFLAFLCIFAGNDTLHFAHLVISLASGTSAASMTSAASLASENKKQRALYILSDFPGIRNLSGLNDLNNLSGLIDLSSLNSSKKLLRLMFPLILATKCHILAF